MKKFDYFIAACRSELYRRRAWVISAFAKTFEGPDAWKKDPYPYRIVQTPAGHFFIDPDKDMTLTKLEDADPNKPPFYIKDRIKIDGRIVPNVTKEIETNYGNLLANAILLIYPFGKKISYLEGRFSASDIENIILPRLKDSPKEGAPRNNDDIYVDEYLKYTNAAMYIQAFMQLWCPAASPKTMTPPPGVAELKARLLAENKDHLNEPATIAKIMKELIKYDSEWLKGDIAERFLADSGKLRKNVRAKLFLMQGAVDGFEDGVDVSLIRNSLVEGWDVDQFAELNNASRVGSFNRGAETMLGGEAVKWLLRSSSNMAVTKDDCGSRLGMPVFLDESKKKKYTGFSVVTPTGHEVLSEENFAKYLGKNVLIRSPQFCNLGKTDYCACCVGPRLAASPTAISSAVSEYGSTFLNLFMKKMHGTSLELAHMDYKTSIT
jgi:hypothetical protein